jgi:pilus assembly protein FimV
VVITVSILAVLIFMLASLFAVLMFQFMRKAKKQPREVAVDDASAVLAKEDQVVAENTESFIKEEVQKESESKPVEEVVSPKIEVEQQSEPVQVSEELKEVQSTENTNNFKPQRAVTEIKSSKEQPSKEQRLLSGNVSALAGDDVLATKLDLARAYLDLNSMRDAKKLLRDVLAKGDDAQRDAAEKLLERFELTV